MNLKELVAKYRKSDSLSERDTLEESILDICQTYLNTVHDIYCKYDKICDQLDEDYRSDRGGISLLSIYGDESIVVVRYKDSWAYGGSCDFHINVIVDDVLSFDAKALEQSLVQIEKDRVRVQIQDHRNAIVALEANLKRLNGGHDS